MDNSNWGESVTNHLLHNQISLSSVFFHICLIIAPYCCLQRIPPTTKVKPLDLAPPSSHPTHQKWNKLKRKHLWPIRRNRAQQQGRRTLWRRGQGRGRGPAQQPVFELLALALEGGGWGTSWTTCVWTFDFGFVFVLRGRGRTLDFFFAVGRSRSKIFVSISVLNPFQVDTEMSCCQYKNVIIKCYVIIKEMEMASSRIFATLAK